MQESVLPAPSMFEQDNLSTLASFVFFSKVDIVKMVLKEPDHIDSCLKSLKDKSTPPRRQVELCGFLKGKKKWKIVALRLPALENLGKFANPRKNFKPEF